MKDREKMIRDVQNIIDGKNKEKDPFSCWVEEFNHIIQNMNWNELRKLATSVNISVNNKRRQEIVSEINAVYMRKNKKGHKRP